MAFETALESELNATLMLIERQGLKALVVGVTSSPKDARDAGADGAGLLARAVSTGTSRRDGEVFIHALRREADRLEKLIGGLTTEYSPT